jgi:hypothetical protein
MYGVCCSEIEQVTSSITNLFREADKVTSALTKQSGEESDSELRVRDMRHDV